MLCPLRLDIDRLGDASPSWPIDQALVQRHCRVDATADDQDILETGLLAAIEWAENAMHRTVFRRTHTWVLREFPVDRYQQIRLPRGRTISVAHIRYRIGGVVTTLTGPTSSPVGTDYQEDLRGDSGGVLMPLRGTSWPSTDLDIPAPVEIEFVAGWDTDEIPADILNAILLATSDAYDMRGTPDFSAHSLAEAGKSLQARNSLISFHTLSRWY
jgi:hypothetical protein